MKNSRLKIYSLGLLATMLASCGGDGTGVVSSKSSSSSSDPAITVQTLSEALSNTTSYQMSVPMEDDMEYVFQIYDDDFFYYSPYRDGYLTLESDPGYYHSFEGTSYGDFVYDFNLSVHGRAASTKSKSIVYYVNFLDILTKYADDFEKIATDTFACTETGMANELKNYFQNRSFGYCNYFEATVGNDGRLASFTAYEKSTDTTLETGTVNFSKFDKNNYAPYKRWVEAGSKSDIRIFDVKTGYFKGLNYILSYEGETVELEGTVSSIDEDGSYYISCQNDSTGNVGIQIKPKTGTAIPSVKDKIKVTGIVDVNGYVAYLKNATYEKTGVDTFVPSFDEEQIVDSYGGGYYAASVFCSNPYYAGSVYSTYAYVGTLPTEVEENKDTTVEMVCPSFVLNNDTFFSMQLVLPKEMSVSSRKAIIESLEAFGVYTKENNEGVQVSLENFILEFDTTYKCAVKLKYASESKIGKAKSPVEKIEDNLGLSSFPLPSSTSFGCYRFGGSSGMYLEETYGRSEKSKQGVYYYASNLTETNVDNEINSLITYGFTLTDKQKDSYSRVHYIYKMGQTVVDIYTQTNAFDGTLTLNMWIYQGEVIYYTKIAELLAEKVSFFNSEDFIQPDGTYESDYTYYELPVVAGKKLETGNYISTVTLDVTEDTFASLRSKYIKEKGYSTYRNSDNSIYNYTTRGSSHYVLYKSIEGSDEKVFLDMSMYPTSDYTFLGHKNFNNRIEIMIYKGSEPLSATYQTNLDDLFKSMEYYQNGAELPKFNFPSDTKIEMVYGLEGDEQFNYTYYGYFMDTNAFIYSSSIGKVYDALVEGLKEAGYSYQYSSEAGNDTYACGSAYVLLMKNTDRNYVRVINDIGGVDF